VSAFLAAADYAIAAGTLMEIQFGIARIADENPGKAARLADWYDDIVASGTPIIETGLEVAKIWGRLASDSRLNNLRVHHAGQRKFRALQDLHIAAAAIANGSAIATVDVDDFMLIHRCHPLPGVYNPATDVWHAGDPVRACLRASTKENSNIRRSVADFLNADKGTDDLVASPSRVLADK
jgi:predicted nucleic acid-binding protein